MCSSLHMFYTVGCCILWSQFLLQSMVPTLRSPDTLVALNFKFHYLFPGPPESKEMQKDVRLPYTFRGCEQTQRQVEGIELHLVSKQGNKHWLKQILADLAKSNYSGWQKDIPLFLHTGTTFSTEQLVFGRKVNWRHGPVIIWDEGIFSFFEYLGTSVPKAETKNELMIFLEENRSVDPSYFQWLLSAIDHYAWTPQCRDTQLVGFSVGSLNNPSVNFQGKASRQSVFLSARPSRWGGAYWSDHLFEFGNFLRQRTSAPFFNGTKKDDEQYFYIPGNSISSPISERGWKQLMGEFMFGRGLLMLYPNFHNQSLAIQQLQASSYSSQRIRDTPMHILNVSEEEKFFPSYCELAMFGFDSKPTSKERLAARGALLLQNVASTCSTCGTLLNAWAKHEWQTYQPSRTSFPEICVADLYAPSSNVLDKKEMSTSGKSGEATKYLLFEPQYGINNQLLAIVKAYAFAEALDRTLVLPPLFFPRVSNHSNNTMDKSNWIDFDRFFKISRQGFRKNTKNFPLENSSLDPISFFSFQDQNRTPSRIIMASREALFDISSNLLMSALGTSEYEIVNLRHIFDQEVSLQKVQHLLGGCQDEVLAFDGMFFTNIEGVDPWVIWPDVLKAEKRIRTAISLAKHKLRVALGTAEYNCYHIRAGDFKKVCKRMEHPTAEDRIAIPRDYFEVVENQGAICWVTPEDLNRALLEDGIPALILSDNPSALNLSFPVTIQTSAWVASALEGGWEKNDLETKLLTLVVEQELCAAAKVAVLNQLSTVSWRIQKLRRDQNFRYWKRKQPLFRRIQW